MVLCFAYEDGGISHPEKSRRRVQRDTAIHLRFSAKDWDDYDCYFVVDMTIVNGGCIPLPLFGCLTEAFKFRQI